MGVFVSTVESGPCTISTREIVPRVCVVNVMARDSSVNWDALLNLEDWNRAWRATLDTGLSERYVPGEGGNPRVLIVGEAPGAQEDSALRPFVGDAGRVLRDLMAAVGLFTGETPHFGLPNCWLTNLVHFRPPGNRTPLPAEISVARLGLRDEWVAVGKPEIIVPVGKIPTQAIFGKKMSILRVAGSLIEHRSRQGKKLKIWPMIHPSFGLRNKSMIPMIEKDWDKFAEWFASIGERY